MNITPYKIFTSSLEGKKHLYIFFLSLIIFSNIIGAMLPYFLKTLIENQQGTGTFLLPIWLFCFIIFAREAGYRFAHYIEIQLIKHQIKKIYTYFYDEIFTRRLNYFESVQSGKLAKRLNYLADGTLYFVENFPWMIAWTALDIIIANILLYNTDFVMFTGYAVWAIYFITLLTIFLRMQKKTAIVLSDGHSEFNGQLNDQIQGATILYSTGSFEYEKARFTKWMSNLIALENRNRLYELLNKGHQGMSVALLWCTMTILMIKQYKAGALSTGDLLLIAGIVPYTTSAVWSVGDVILTAVKKYSDLKSATDFINTDQTYISYGEKNLQHQSSSLCFKNTSFNYPNHKESVLQDISIEIQNKQHLGIVGKSGAGKTTLIKLLLRSYEPTQGSILYNDITLKDYNQKSFNQIFAVVSQDTHMFHRSIYDNLIIAKPTASMTEVISACKKAYIYDMITSLPNGFDTIVGERGIKLSGGQRQRVAIARAILKDSPVLILDEATSSLDSENEQLIQEALKEVMQDKTVIAIAHRLSTLKSMHKIIVLEESQITEQGTIEDLIKQNGTFNKLWNSQHQGFIE